MPQNQPRQKSVNRPASRKKSASRKKPATRKSTSQKRSASRKPTSVEKPVPTDSELWEKAKEEVYATYKTHSAYRSGAVVKRYKELGGRFRGLSKKRAPLTRWFAEEWTDIGGREYPVYRPTIRVTKDTPLTASEIDPQHAKKQVALKQRIRNKSNLPPFERARSKSKAK